MLREEAHLAALYPEHALLQVDNRLVRLQHVQPEEQVYVAALHAASEMVRRCEGRENVFTSMIVNEHGRNRFSSLSCALCTRPRMRAVPTPRAMPENRLSRRRMML